jgi:hypothetical protein
MAIFYALAGGKQVLIAGRTHGVGELGAMVGPVGGAGAGGVVGGGVRGIAYQLLTTFSLCSSMFKSLRYLRAY